MGSLLLCFTSLLCMLLLWLCFGFASTFALSANSSSSKFLCPHDQTNALLLFLKSFSIGRPVVYNYPSTNLKTWKEDTDCCSWDGVSCDLQTGHLIGLHLSNSGLRGRIYSNNTLLSFHRLQVLDLSFNDLIGPIPSKISHLSKLVTLDLSFSKSQSLSLESVTFDRLVQNLTHLKDLHLSYVDMSLVTPNSFINISSSLSSLHLSNCGLNGRLPDYFFQKFSNLKSLFLTKNQELLGSFTSVNQSNYAIEFLALSYSGLSITLQEELVNNLKSLKMFFAVRCNFEGSDMSQLNKLAQLKALHLSSNNFSDQIPFSFHNLTRLSALYLRNNSFSGHIRKEIANLTQLYWLDLSNNFFEGHFPSSLVNLKQLELLDLSSNKFVGEIPSSLSNLKRLFYLDLSFNNFSSSIDNYTMSLTRSPFCLPSLNYFVLANNHFSGEVDHFVHCSKSLEFIDLSHNKFHGPIPTSIFGLANLSTLILSSNDKLSGELSSEICKLEWLQILDLSNNTLIGPIPSCLSSSHNSLLVLNLGMNKFKGMLPSIFSKGNVIQYLNFYGNKLNGKIPLSRVNCKRLEVLDLGNNKINDTFPSFLVTLLELKVLILRSNELHGSLKRFNPMILIPKLKIFDLSHNNLNGDLPNDYFDKLKRVDENITYMRSNSSVYYSVTLILKGFEIEMVKIQSTLAAVDLSGNKFTGQIPKSVGELLSLKHFNISSNKFDGPIPLSIENLMNLESLDLSCNLLKGRIPPQLSNLTFLSKLNLSFNKLEGPIPQGNQFNTFENSSFLGNLELCGSPLTKSCKDDESWRRTVQIQVSEFESKFGFGWVPVVVGYGCGLIVGIIMGCLVFKTRRPARLVRTIEGYAREIVRRRKRNARRRSGGRRN